MKLFVSDLDGTLLNGAFQISGANREAIELISKYNIQFVVATGRIYHDAAMIFQKYGVSPYIIASNGACIFDDKGSQIFGCCIPYAELKKIIAYLEKIQVCYGVGNSRYYIAPLKWEQMLDQEAKRLKAMGQGIAEETLRFAKMEMLTQNGFKVMDIVDGIKRGPIDCYSISVVTYDQEAIQKIIKYVEQFETMAVTPSGSHTMEIMSKEGTKGNALRYLADRLDVKPVDIAAIGNSFNDLSMLQYAKISIAMGNAEDEVKAACRLCTTDCSEDGFAAAVTDLINKIGRRRSLL